MDERCIPSSGGKKFSVRQNGAEVEMAWVDEAFRDGDALFAPEDAVSLGEALILIGRDVQQREGETRE